VGRCRAASKNMPRWRRRRLHRLFKKLDRENPHTQGGSPPRTARLSPPGVIDPLHSHVLPRPITWRALAIRFPIELDGLTNDWAVLSIGRPIWKLRCDQPTHAGQGVGVSPPGPESSVRPVGRHHASCPLAVERVHPMGTAVAPASGPPCWRRRRAFGCVGVAAKHRGSRRSVTTTS
jgi:hypothetical protein